MPAAPSAAHVTALATPAPPQLEAFRTLPAKLVAGQPWTVSFRLTNNGVVKKTLTGWVVARAYLPAHKRTLAGSPCWHLNGEFLAAS